ncbi:DNA topoisomerase IB [Amorphus coralli]|uniref:DNA topoisomerase IB n=1 Tax=Amorphus coralli TaxID=340680 RepID=UPI00037664B1|nr:DNA topoisomerase IB [Amorphus coralli]
MKSQIETTDLVPPPPEEFARAAELVYMSDDVPGITRRRSGRGFSYRDAEGVLVRDRVTLARIRGLAVPPAYVDVWICPLDTGHIQATGRDARGRKQYRYHPRWVEVRDKAKYDGLVAFGSALPAMRERVDADMRRRTLDRNKVLASIVWLLEHTFVRIGNTAYARENRSYGLTTLRRRHLKEKSSALRLKFTGKSGKAWSLRLTDRRIRRVVKACHELSGQHLFQYLDDGEPRPVASQDVNAYIREISGAEFTSKHFRTWAGTVLAATRLAGEEPPTSKTDAARKINAALDEVSRTLGNTRAVCRRCYVHPLVFERFVDASLAARLAATGTVDADSGLEEDEQRVLAWLRDERAG